MPISEVYNQDCMEGMKNFPDKFFDLAIIDPPYGIENKISKGGGSHTKSSVKFHQLYSENYKAWDKAVSKEYFDALFRVSKNQIIFGANYYSMPPTRGFLIYDKPEMRIATMSDCEFAWTSFDKPAKIFTISRGFNNHLVNPVFHPTQKPIKLYKQIIEFYAKIGDKILDTHLGSQSSRIAAYKLGFDFWGYEIDEDYFKQGCERFDKAIAEPLFEQVKVEQSKLFINK